MQILIIYMKRAAAIETTYAYSKNINPINLSEQQIIDCTNYLTVNSKYKPNQGCIGGLIQKKLQ